MRSTLPPGLVSACATKTRSASSISFFPGGAAINRAFRSLAYPASLSARLSAAIAFFVSDGVVLIVISFIRHPPDANFVKTDLATFDGFGNAEPSTQGLSCTQASDIGAPSAENIDFDLSLGF
jgi:hypothetical protein